MLVALAGCPGGQRRGRQGARQRRRRRRVGRRGRDPECSVDSDCEAAGLKCCDCPTYAVPARDPAVQRVRGRDVPGVDVPRQRPARRATAAQCVLACKPLACDLSCADGFMIDATGCEACACAAPAGGGVRERRRLRARARGLLRMRRRRHRHRGRSRATRRAYDAAPDVPRESELHGRRLRARRIRRPHACRAACELVSPLPAGACGRRDLPACPPGQFARSTPTTQATARGVGVCM